MPERIFRVSWPDGDQVDYYSPSSVIDQHFSTEKEYALADFVFTTTKALNHASDRVSEKYGYACSSAMDQLQKIQHRAQRYNINEKIKIIHIRDNQ